MVEAGIFTTFPVPFNYGCKHGIAGPESGVSYNIEANYITFNTGSQTP